MKKTAWRWFTSAFLFAAGSACLASAPALAAARAPEKLEAYLSYPFIDALASAKSGDAAAWVETRKGVRNVWLASGPDFRARQLTHGTSDDGQQILGLTFSPDGKTLAWSHGGAEGNPWAGAAPAPDPASTGHEPHTEIWAVSVSGGAPRKLADDGEEPSLSAKGQLTYLKAGQVWTVDLAGKTPPARLFYDRGKDSDMTWSPDGSKLAFVSHRGDHSFVGVYRGPDHPLVWLSPSTAFDEDPAWSPDSERVVFSRRDGEADILASPLVEKPAPFSLWVGSASDGSAGKIWSSPVTLNGSYPELPDGLFLMWAAGDKIVFRAEMDGWPHLYSVPAAGGALTVLTPGAFMVEHVTMTADRRALYYSANAGLVEGDTDRRHVFRVPVDRAEPKALTPGAGLEWTPVPLGADQLAYIAATATSPIHLTLASVDGGKVQTLSAAGETYTGGPFVTPKPVTFTAADGLVVHGQLFMPPTGGAKHPAMIFVHGGPPRQMLLGWSYMDYYTHAYAMNQYLASRGFVVLSVNYRLGIGYGRAFQHPAKAGVAGDAEYQDVLAGAAFLQKLPEVDASRLGIWGGSYGGLLTAQALSRNSNLFKVGVDLHGVHDWSMFPGFAARPARFEQGDHDASLKSAFDSSPEAAIKGWTSPVLLIHGDDDRNVPFDQTVDLARRLSAQGAPFEELILPNEIHGFLRYDSWVQADSATIRFLEAVLKP